ncbi:MAG: response regulator [Nitrospirae bacterium]|nr:response regulator [Nitrospirota bacterium]
MRARILVVEDMDKNRKLLVAILEYNGYEVVEACNGAEGVRAARDYMPDLILMDIQMPVMGGVEAMRALKAAPDTSGIKVVALTSFAMKGDREKFLAEGFADYITKPINTRELPETIRKLLE